MRSSDRSRSPFSSHLFHGYLHALGTETLHYFQVAPDSAFAHSIQPRGERIGIFDQQDQQMHSPRTPLQGKLQSPYQFYPGMGGGVLGFRQAFGRVVIGDGHG